MSQIADIFDGGIDWNIGNDSPSSPASGGNSAPTGQWWSNFFGGASDLVNSIGGASPNIGVQTTSEVKMNQNQMLMIGLGIGALILLLKKK